MWISVDWGSSWLLGSKQRLLLLTGSWSMESLGLSHRSWSRRGWNCSEVGKSSWSSWLWLGSDRSRSLCRSSCNNWSSRSVNLCQCFAFGSSSFSLRITNEQVPNYNLFRIIINYLQKKTG